MIKRCGPADPRLVTAWMAAVIRLVAAAPDQIAAD